MQVQTLPVQPVVPIVTSDPSLSDITMYVVVAMLAILKGIEIAKRYNLIPDVNSQSSIRTVGKLTVDSLEEVIRQVVRDELSSMQRTLSGNTTKQVDKLDLINLGIQKVATILEERKQRRE